MKAEGLNLLHQFVASTLSICVMFCEEPCRTAVHTGTQCSLYADDYSFGDVVKTDYSSLTANLVYLSAPEPFTCIQDVNDLPHIPHLSDGHHVMCQEVDNITWLVIQKRESAMVEFKKRLWEDCKHGFGNILGNFWFGLDKIHNRCNKDSACRLRLDMTYNGQDYWAVYDLFFIEDEAQKYKLTVSGKDANSTADGDFSRIHDGMMFSTIDQRNDNSSSSESCASRFGPWWHKTCGDLLLNGAYMPDSGYGIYHNPLTDLRGLSR